MADNIELNITATDSASSVLDEVAQKAQAIDGASADVTVEATDNAGDVLDEDQSKVETLDGTTAEVTTDATDNAGDVLDEDASKVTDLDGSTATVSTDATDDASATLEAVQGEVDGLDGSTPTISPEVSGSAEEDLANIASEADALDGASPEITPQVDPSGEAKSGIEGLSGAVDFLAGRMGAEAGSVTELTGVIGGFGGALGTTAAAAIPAAAGIAAVGEVAKSSVESFTTLGERVLNFTEKTGASADEASRLIAVGDDLGVSQDAIAGAISRVAREIDQGKLQQYGIQSGTVTQQFQQMIDYIQSLPDENQRAAVSFQVFGRSYLALAPLLDTTEKLADRQKDVNPGQILSDADVERFKEFRDAGNKVADTITGIKDQIGKIAIGPLTDLLNTINGLVKVGGEINNAIPDWIKTVGENIAKYNPIIAPYTAALAGLHAAANLLSSGDPDVVVVKTGKAAEDATPKVAALESQDKALEQAQKDAATAADKQRQALVDLANQVAGNTVKALEAQTQQIKTNQALQDYGKTVNDAKLSTDQHTLALDDMTTKLINTATKTGDAAVAQGHFATKTDESAASINAQIGYLQAVEQTLAPNDPLRANLDAYIAQLNGVKSNIETTVTIQDEQALASLNAIKSAVDNVKGDLASASGLLGGLSGRMSGGPIEESGFFTVGEAGPETVFLPGGSNVRTAGDTMAANSLDTPPTIINNINVTVSPFSSPAQVGREIQKALDAYYRTSGSRLRAIS